jgi:hypothetical protein
MPFNKIDAKEKKEEFLEKHPEEKYSMIALDRLYEIRKTLHEVRTTHNINLEYISKETGMKIKELQDIEHGKDTNILNILKYAKVLESSLYVRPWEG